MAIRRIPIDELVGINRNAVHGAAQSAPVEIKGFDLGQMGGYVAAWRQADTALVTGITGVVRAYDPYGDVLFAGAQVLWSGTLSDQSSGSIAGKGTYLVPHAGVFTNAAVRSGDEYELGGYFRDSFGSTGDLNRVSGASTTVDGSGSGLTDGTYRFLILIEAPTAHGFAVYQTITVEQATASDDSVTVEIDEALPLGYAARCYWWLSGSGEVGFTEVEFRKVSDGSLISFTFDDDTADPTSDAILGFSQDFRRVEPHRNRMWGVSGPEPFVGPYVAGFTVEQRFRANPSSGEFLLSTPDNPDALNGTAELSVIAEFNEGISWQSSTQDVLWTQDGTELSDEVDRYAHDVAIDSDGNVLVVLNRGSPPDGGDDSTLVKLDPDGTELWDFKISDPFRFARVEVDADGNVYTSEWSTASSPVVVRKFQPDGTAVWDSSISTTDTAYDLAVEWDGSNVYVTTHRESPASGSVYALSSSGTVSDPFRESGFQPLGVTADPHGKVTVAWHDPSEGSTKIIRYTAALASEDWTRTQTSLRQPTSIKWSPTSALNDGELDVVVLYSDPRGNSPSDYPLVTRYRGGDGVVDVSESLSEVSDSTHPLARSLTVGPGGQVVVAGRAFGNPDIIVLDSETLEVLEVMSAGPGDSFSWSVAANRRGELAVGSQHDGQFPGHVMRLRSTHQWAPIARRGDQFEAGVVFSLKEVGSAIGEVAQPYAFMEGLEQVGDLRLRNSAGQEVWDHGSPTTLLSSHNFEFGLDTSSLPLKWRIKNSSGSTVDSASEDPVHWENTTMPSSDADLEFGGGLSLSGGDLRHDWFWTEVYDDDSQTTTLASAEAEDWSSGTTFTSSETSETWTIDSDPGGVEGGLAQFSSTLNPNTTLIYSELGDVNTGSDENYVQLALLSSQRVTALSSTPAGLVAFCDNECFLIRGDPVLGDFQVQRLSGTVGCDAGTQPGRLGNVVFPIWKGRVYSLSLGMGDVDFGSGLADISPPVYDPSDPFVQVVGEPRSRQVIARTEGGVILRYAPERQAWFTDVYSGEGVSLLVPDDGDVGVRYRIGSGLWLAVEGADSPNVKWEQVDLGDKLLRKLWRRFYLYTNDGYDGDPVLEYEINGNSGSVTGLSEGDGQWSFTLPHGIVSSTAQVLNMVMEGATEHDAMEQPMEIEVVDRYRRR